MNNIHLIYEQPGARSLQYKVIVITSDAENAELISKRFNADSNIVAEVISEDQLKSSLNVLNHDNFHALVLSDSLDGDWEKNKELLTAGRNISVIRLPEANMVSDSLADSILTSLETRFAELAERLSLANALQQKDADMQHIIEKSADSILIFDEDGRVLFMNPAAHLFFGDNIEIGSDFGYPVASGDTTEIDLISSSGERAVADMRVTSIEWSGQLACLAILRDITERKITEELLEQKVEERTSALESATAQLIQMYRVSEQAVQLRSRFIANVSHEIRTPLSGIVSGAELLCQSPDAQTAAELGPLIFSSAKSLLDLVNEILDFAKMERGEVTLQISEFVIRNLVHDIIKQMQPLADQKQLRLISDISPRIGVSYLGDVGKIRQILFNLVHNALKFTNDGGVIINVKPGDGELVQFGIFDTGMGIENKDISLIFQPFVQASSTLLKQSGGTGLGLSICSQLAKSLSGSITCQSELGKGSTFTLQVPLRKV